MSAKQKVKTQLFGVQSKFAVQLNVEKQAGNGDGPHLVGRQLQAEMGCSSNAQAGRTDGNLAAQPLATLPEQVALHAGVENIVFETLVFVGERADFTFAGDFRSQYFDPPFTCQPKLRSHGSTQAELT